MVRWVVGSILHGGPIELFLVRQCSTTGITGRGMCYPVCGMSHIKELLLLIERAAFLSRYLSGPLPYV